MAPWLRLEPTTDGMAGHRSQSQLGLASAADHGNKSWEYDMRFLNTALTKIACVVMLSMGLASIADAQAIKKYIVMRVNFQDSGATAPRYSRSRVKKMLVNVTN